MSAGDYRNAVAGLDSDHAVTLTGKPVLTPWDPAMVLAMSAHGLAVHEESVLDEFVADLAGEIERPRYSLCGWYGSARCRRIKASESIGPPISYRYGGH
jgi:hypothetical protein